ncbi:glycosyltransferase [Ciceribacter sp. L1K23]|uniref:CgeB family protein n=1 Tax=Ciceribacter sp. L1K23 TaxID=2820276 RepID=UPI001B8273C0|nr:glycosyltransferase [Ciceribacter sp. L1K23]MBR0557077.1 glycosyltransferase [Ciceribacter sp. L1K23]
MKFVFYTHSLVSDWNHGNAHFLRGVMSELQSRGHKALALEPKGSWSLENLLSDQGETALLKFHETFPLLRSIAYDESFDHEAVLAGADVVVVHEWTDPALISRLGSLRAAGASFQLLFHDTHHRAVSSETDISSLQLAGYDGILAFGETLRQRYLDAGWGRQVFTWHEAADERLFRPMPEVEATADLVWVGNWGDDERSAEIIDFLVEPAKDLGLDTTVRGVRYPSHAVAALAEAGIAYQGWIANAEVPALFARHRVTVHIPRRPYVESLPGIPTIRVFEALACGIPLVSAPWEDSEGLFRPGTDFLVARNGSEMKQRLRDVLNDKDLSNELRRSGLETIRARHTCRHRVDELMHILLQLSGETSVLAKKKEAAE